MALVCVMALGGAAWGASAWRIGRVHVVGLRRVSANVVVQAAGLGAADRYLLTRMTAVAARVSELPQVRSVSVARRLPATIEIRVTEREPAVSLQGFPELVADEEGRVFARPGVAVQGDPSLPTLSGFTGKPRAGSGLDAASARLIDDFTAFPQALRGLTTGLRSGDDVVVQLGPTAVRFGRPERMGAKAAAALAVLDDAYRQRINLEYVDVRAPGTPVARQVVTPAPTAAPTRKPATPKPGATPVPTKKPTPKPATAKPATPKPATPKPATATPSTSGH